jgi:pyruvate,water dikinase
MSNVIETPADFPIQWRSADDATRLWAQDRLHYPDQVTPLEFCLIEEAVDAGLTKAARAYAIPIVVHDRHINSYLYVHIEPVTLTTAEAAALAQEAETRLETAMAQLTTRWQTNWLPEIEEHLAAWQHFDLAGADLPALLAHLEASEGRFQRLWELHFLLFLPSMLALSQFADLYADLFAEATPLDAYQLLAGVESKTLASGQALWALSRQALASPVVYQVLTTTPPAAVLSTLAQSAEGRAFLPAFDAYLQEHGYRGDKLSLHYPFWVEEPTPVVKLLADYVAQPDRDLAAERQAIAAARLAALQQVRAQLRTYPQPVRARFDFLLQAAQAGAWLKEEHGYWIDYKGSYYMRQVLLTIGQRLAAVGDLAECEDLFYLTLAEVKALMQHHSAGQPSAVDYGPLINERKAVATRFAAIVPPPLLGSLPAGPSPDDPVSRMFLKIEGDTPPSQPTDNLLRGHAGSPGVARGPAKIVRQLKDMGKIQPGDILIAETTAPPWTPLFASVAAVVTDNGGILSHAAVIAREYGIPAVIGVQVATRLLHDGQQVEVDGTQGIVRIAVNAHPLLTSPTLGEEPHPPLPGEG